MLDRTGKISQQYVPDDAPSSQGSLYNGDGVSLNGESVQLPEDANYRGGDESSSINTNVYEGGSAAASNFRVPSMLCGDEESSVQLAGNAEDYYDNDDASLDVSSINTSVYYEGGADDDDIDRTVHSGDGPIGPIGTKIASKSPKKRRDTFCPTCISGARPCLKVMFALGLLLLLGGIVYAVTANRSSNAGINSSANSSAGSNSTTTPAIVPTMAPSVQHGPVSQPNNNLNQSTRPPKKDHGGREMYSSSGLRRD